jgi:hypothetical protein
MKNLKTLIGLTALVAVIILTLGSCVINVPGDDNGGSTTENYNSIEGDWSYGSSYGSSSNNWRIRISGRRGYITYVPTGLTGYSWDAVNRGYVKNGTDWFQNISPDGTRRWTARNLVINYRGDTATGIDYIYCVITMAADGQTFSDGGNTWYRR